MNKLPRRAFLAIVTTSVFCGANLHTTEPIAHDDISTSDLKIFPQSFSQNSKTNFKAAERNIPLSTIETSNSFKDSSSGTQNTLTNIEPNEIILSKPMKESTETSSFNDNASENTPSTNMDKISKAEKLRLHRKKIQEERRAKLKEFRAKNKHIPPPPTETDKSSSSSKIPKSGKLRSMKPDSDSLQSMSRDEVDNVISKNRELWGVSSGISTNAYDISTTMADPGAEYDEWQQAYRTLGAFVDCDHSWGGDSHSGDDNNGDRGCNRWMMWASYVDPNYQGGGYEEYHYDRDDDNDGDDAEDGAYYGKLDCHLDNTEWQLLGVYRQEFYQYLEQISKHLWGNDEWEYTVALATLEYIGDDECEAVGYDNNAQVLYAAVQPLPLGYFQMGLYSDENCLYPLDLDEIGYTYDDFYAGDDRRQLANDDQYDGDDDAYWWASAQEYTLADANEVYDTFKYCTLCIDYPTYQDGEINGDSGYDDGDLINQCWKFYSHDSFTCGGECIRSGHAQGGITNLKYGENYFGNQFTDDYTTGSSSSSSSKKSSAAQESGGNFLFTREKMDRLKANVFVTFAGILFVATFLAFSVARSTRELPRSPRQRRRKSKDGRTKELLDTPDRGERRKRRSKNRRDKSSSHYKPPTEGGKRSRSRKSRTRDHKREQEEGYRADDF